MVFDAVKLRIIREKRNFTVTEMCSKMVMANQYYRSIEEGQNVPTIKTINKIAHALGIPAKSLLKES